MKEYKSRTSRRQEEEENNNTKKKIMMIILLIIMLLSLITSCSCTSNFFGKIGSLFENFGKHEIDDNPDNPEIITNRELKFDTDKLEISVSDAKAKIGFSYKNINPKEFTCSTNDAEVATCYVLDGYVVVNPRKPGKVTVTLQTTVNGKIYKATAEVVINDSERYIALSSYAGSINLAYGKNRTITYSLVGLTGNATVTSSDESVAKVTVKDGAIKITANKVGKATITVSLEHNGQTYTAEYKLNVINDPNSSSGNNKPEDPGTNKPKDNISTLADLTTDKGTLTPSFSSNTLEYYIGVSWWTWNITLNATATNSNVQNKMIYSYKRADKDTYETVDSLKNLSLKTGDNIVIITVTAEDGSKTIYKVTINRAFGDYLKSLTPSTGTLTPAFDSHTLGYTMEVPSTTNKLTLTAVPHDDKAELFYTFNGVTRNNLEDLYLVTGPNIVTVTVKNNGLERTYKVVINKLSDSGSQDTNSMLTSLVVDGKDQLNFNPFVKNYNLGVDYGTANVLLSASASSPNAKISFTYKGVTTSGGNVFSLQANNLEVGDNKVIVTVTNGSESTEYTVNINRASNPYTGVGSNTLDNLSVVGSDGKLNPAFNSNQMDYTVIVGKDITDIKLLAEASTGTNVSYYYNGVWTDGKNIDISGLKPGENKVIIKATDGLGNSRDYVVTIIREQDAEAQKDLSLKEVLVDGNKIDKYLSDTTYKADVAADTNSVKLNAIPTNNGATITYTYNGKTLTPNSDGTVDVNNLIPGANVVKVTVSMNGESKSYDVIIKKADKTETLPSTATLDAFTIGGTSVLGGGTVEFEANDTINVAVTPTDNLSTVEYFIGTTKYNTLQELNNALNNMSPDSTVKVTVKVTAQDGTTTNSYTATVVKKPDSTPTPDDKITIELDGSTLTPIGGYYYATVDSFDKKKIPITVKVPNGSQVDSYKLCNEDGTVCTPETDDMSTLELNPGWNILTITGSEAGVDKTITVKIYRPERSIEFESTSYTCTLEDGCNPIVYVIKEKTASINSNGSVVYSENQLGTDVTSAYENVAITINPEAQIERDGNKITVKPNAVGSYELKATKDGYKETTATLTVKSNDYVLNVQAPSYTVKVNSGKTSFETVIVETSLFKNNNLDSTKIIKGTDSISICSTDGKVCLKAQVENPALISSLEFDPDGEQNPDFIKIKVKGNTPGDTKLTFTAVVNGHTVKSTKTALHVVATRLITLYANKVVDGTKTYYGKFFEKELGDGTIEPVTEATYEIEQTEELDLSGELAPYVTSEDNCSFYEFKGYSTNADAKPEDVEYTKTSIISGNGTDLKLYAIYSTEKKVIDIETDIKDKILWLEDVPIFGEKKLDEKGNPVDNLIYPSANGSYTAVIKNTTNQIVYLTGIKISETKTVCTPKGCLNMGYIVKATDPDDETKTFYYLKNKEITNTFAKYTDDLYKVLNDGKTGGDVAVDFRTLGTNEDKIEEDRTGKIIKIEPGQEKEIAILWRWVELSDEVDTSIGTEAGNNPINNMYSISVGIEYTIYNNECLKN